MDRLKSLKGCVNVLRANHTNAPFLERFPCSLRRFNLNTLYTDYLENVLCVF